MALAMAGFTTVTAIAGTPGLDAPVAIGPFLNQSFPEAEPTGASQWSVQETYTGININLPMHLMPYPGTNKLLCIAKEGRIFLFDDNATATVADTFLDLRSQTFTSSDCGMTWLVCHPEFGQSASPNRDYVYITYKWKPAGGNGHEAYWRLSRFTVILQSGKPVANPASEQILIQQYDRQEWHDSGCMMFGPDGYLYVGIGDEGGANDEYNDGQKINERLFSGILRIDVDQKVTSHAIRRQPTQLTMPAGWPNSFTANYKIPADNPFNDVSGSRLEEFYAMGLRNPYRFSYDPVTNRTWIGDVGQDTREEIDILTAGGNYGWPFREGSIARPTGPQPPVVPNPLTGTLVEPVWDSPHGTDGCVVGGFVYRGAAFPYLTGKFISVDNVNSHIRAHELNGAVATNQILTAMPSGGVYSGTSTIGRDAAGEPIFIKINGTGVRGRFFKLVATPIVPPTRAGWFRFEEQAVANTSGFVSENPDNATINSLPRGVPLLAYDNETTNSANAKFTPGNGLTPTGSTASISGVRLAKAVGTTRPGNSNGDLYTPVKLGVINDFTVELSFRPAAGSLASGYQTFLGVDGLTGTAIQPFRLMRYGANDTTMLPFAIQNGDLILDVRTVNPATSQWTSVAIKVLAAASFTADQWYHMAIVGNVSAGTLTVFSHNPATGIYTQIGQATGYVGNLQAGAWTVGRGHNSGNPTDWVTDTTFDEVRLSDNALPPSKFLYGSEPFVPVIPPTDPPPTLSQTGAFSNLATLTPAPGVVPYGVNAPLWSDGAEKMRWIALPNDGIHDTPAEKIKFLPESNWTFPPGTVFIKHFELPVDDTNPSILRRLETRFVIVPTTGEPYGLTYKWRADGSDADLLPGGSSEVIDIATTGGGTRQQTWEYPSRGDCRICHNGNADYILGVKTQQLNGNFSYPLTGRTANQLETFGALGWFSNDYRADLVPWMLQSHHLAQATASLADRARSYLDSNCSQCHQPGGVRAYFDARYTTPLDEQGLVNGELETSYGDPSNRVIVPGDPNHSILLLRLGSVAEIKMPPLAKHVVDQAAVGLLTEWINSLGTGPSVALSTPSPPTGPFTLDVHFSQSVTGLTADDFEITGASIGSLTGTGADYAIQVIPAGFGTVTVKLPAARATNGGGLDNYASALFSREITDPYLVSWLKLDDGAGSVAVDSSATGSNGSLIAMTSASWIPGHFGGALAFDSTDQRVIVQNPVGTDFTLSFWMKATAAFPLTDAPASGAAIVNADVGGAANDFIIAGTRNASGVNRISFQTGQAGGSNSILHGTTPVNSGQWIHIAVTRIRTSGAMKIYVNGLLENSMNGSTAFLTGNSVISIGATPGVAARSYEGQLDEIRMFSRALDAAEIVALGTGPAPAPPYSLWVESWLPGIYHLHGPGLDPEGDGLTNFGEFAFGGDPLAHGVIPTPLERAADGSVTLSYRARKAPAGAVYSVRVSADLAQWTDAAPDITATVTQNILGTDYEWVTVTYLPPTAAGPNLYFRIQTTH